MAKKIKYKSKIIIASVFAAVILLSGLSVYSCYFKGTVTGGVYVNGTDLGGMTKAEAVKAVSENSAFENESNRLIISYKNKKADIDASEIGVYADIDATAEKAFAVGKKGNILSRLAEILMAKISHENLSITLKAEDKLLSDVLAPFEELIENPVVQAKSRISGDEIIITPGKSGNGIDKDMLMEDISAVMYGRKNKIKLSVKEQQPASASAKGIYETYRKDVKDAEYIKQADGKIGITPSVVGVDFSLKTAERKIKEQKKGGEIAIPVKVTEPKVYTEDLEEKLFADTLSSYDSTYAPGNSGRNINLELACSKMAGVEMMPGEVFSYTGTIGNGTYEEGYVDAPVYSGGEIQTGVGGGICQGSSTLYCAVLFADLEIVERVNHSMPVGYVPAGMDATIATPTIDFKFRNSSKYPIRLDVSCGGGYLNIEIKGTEESPSKKVEISNKLISTKEFEVKEVENEALAEGEEIVKQNGSNGSVVETYKTVTLDGEESTTLVSTSRYSPIPKIVEVSKKKEESEKTEEVTEENPPEAEEVLADTAEEEVTEIVIE